MKTHNTTDKSKWKPGPWIDEPDRLEWRKHGFPCLIVRADTTGALCGYVGLPAGHPMYGWHHYDVTNNESKSPPVHGGLTYSGSCQGHICHEPLPGESDDIWWIGFDCAHGFDYIPDPRMWWSERYDCLTNDLDINYRDINYVKAQVESLAEQMIVK